MSFSTAFGTPLGKSLGASLGKSLGASLGKSFGTSLGDVIGLPLRGPRDRALFHLVDQFRHVCTILPRLVRPPILAHRSHQLEKRAPRGRVAQLHDSSVQRRGPLELYFGSEESPRPSRNDGRGHWRGGHSDRVGSRADARGGVRKDMGFTGGGLQSGRGIRTDQKARLRAGERMVLNDCRHGNSAGWVR